MLGWRVLDYVVVGAYLTLTAGTFSAVLKSHVMFVSLVEAYCLTMLRKVLHAFLQNL